MGVCWLRNVSPSAKTARTAKGKTGCLMASITCIPKVEVRNGHSRTLPITRTAREQRPMRVPTTLVLGTQELGPLPPPHLPQRRLRPLGDLGVVVLGELLKRGYGVLGRRADHAEGGDGFVNHDLIDI